MRYAHMVREHQTLLPVPPMAVSSSASRKLRTTAKRANTIALDVRNTLSKAGAPGNIAFAVLVSPFIIALFMILTSYSSPSAPDTLAPTHTHTHSHTHSRWRGSPRKHLNSSSIIDLTASHIVHFDLVRFLKRQTARHKIDDKKTKGITLIAACQNRRESLLLSYPSWSSLPGVDQIILVEWAGSSSSNNDNFNWHTIPQFDDDMRAKRTTVVLTQSSGSDIKWSLSRAYNLAARFAIGAYLLKVDCDTFLQPDFLSKNPPPETGEFYTVTEGSERSINERKLSGVWFARKEDFQRAGGYDERLVTYGHEDIDLYDRMITLAGLATKIIDLNSLRHNVGVNLAYKHDAHYFVSRRVSIRVNKAMLEQLPKWPDVKDNQANTYSFFYDTTHKVIVANLTHPAPDPLHERSEEERNTLLTTVLKTGLHDDFELPWDILESLSLDDLIHLAHFCDSDAKPHVLVVLLEGKDVLTNTFNLVSATYLAMTRATPTIIVWTLPDDGHVLDTSVHHPLLAQLLDLNATNEQLKRTVASSSSELMRHSLPGAIASTEHVRIMAAHKWCNEPLDLCADKYDGAYRPFWEISARVPHVYNENDPMPISTSHHTVIRLSDKTLVGSHAMRKAAFHALVPGPVVRDAQVTAFGDENMKPKVAVILNDDDDVTHIVDTLKHDHPTAATNADHGKLLPVTGARHATLRETLLERKEINGKPLDNLFCKATGGADDTQECDVKQMGMEFANVLAVSKAETLFPPSQDGESHGDDAMKEAWMQRKDVQRLMATDLWGLNNQ